jgi:hypothetical protein
MQRILGEEGIQLLTSTEAVEVRGRSGEQVNVTVRTRAGERGIEGSDILVATGRVPNTAGIRLDDTSGRPIWARRSRRSALIARHRCPVLRSRRAQRDR